MSNCVESIPVVFLHRSEHLKCRKAVVWPGLCPGPPGGAYSAHSDSLAGGEGALPWTPWGSLQCSFRLPSWCGGGSALDPPGGAYSCLDPPGGAYSAHSDSLAGGDGG